MNSTHPVSQPSLPPELSALAAEFKAWRTQRPSRRTPIPDALRHEAVSLLDRCRRSHVIKALGINSTTLKAWQSLEVATEEQPLFVPLSIASTSEAAQPPSLELTLSNRAGQKVILQGSFSAAQLALVAQALSSSTQEEHAQ